MDAAVAQLDRMRKSCPGLHERGSYEQAVSLRGIMIVPFGWDTMPCV
jgi:hypothetical protein